MKEKSYMYRTDKDHRFFLHDPEVEGFMFFATAADRDEASFDMIHSHLDDSWSEYVTSIIAGEVTHHTVRCDVKHSPRREDSDTDESYEEAMGEYGSEFESICDYKLVPFGVEE